MSFAVLPSTRVLWTGGVLLAAAALVAYKYWDYFAHPWTRDGQVRAYVVQITPRVSAPIVELPIMDNQVVKPGDLLFRLDARTFDAALQEALATLAETQDDIEALDKQVVAARESIARSQAVIAKAETQIRAEEAKRRDAESTLGRFVELAPRGAVSQQELDSARARRDVAEADLRGSRAQLAQARAELRKAEADLAKSLAERGAEGEANARLRVARAAVESARLDREFTEVRAPVDGYITNLQLRLGSQGVANQPALALVDRDSFWIAAYFRETLVGDIRPGDRAIVTLMTYPDRPLEGRVDSLGWGIAQQDGSTSHDLLPSISPTFEWIRLAQRVPVRIHLVDVPPEIDLRVGTTASVLVMTGTADAEPRTSVPPVPRALQ
jgi:multidrug resistance efflux pump